jgi:hypothetical protein
LDAESASVFDESSGLAVGLIAQIHAVRCNLQMELGEQPDLQAAAEEANLAVAQFPQVPDAHLAVAMVVGMVGKSLATTPGADLTRLAEHERILRKELDEAIRLDPSYGWAYFMRAGMHAAFGPREKAIVDLREAKRLLPKLDPRLEQSVLKMIETTPASRSLPPKQPASQDSAEARVTIAILDVLKRALREYLNDHPSYPESGIEKAFKELGPNGSGSLVLSSEQVDRQGRILDGWGRSLVYRRTDDGGFRLYSLGPDGRDDDGSGDDIQLPDK